MRRLRRRLAAAGIQSITEYVRYLQRHPEEELALVSTFLIKVTQFFRDPDLFTALREADLCPRSLRAVCIGITNCVLWSVGCCSHGEEAYLLGIVLAEVLGEPVGKSSMCAYFEPISTRKPSRLPDRACILHLSLAGVSEEILTEHFDLVDGGYQVKKALRAMMVFGQHNLGDRAPFPRVDLILCRNVLIYFTPELQRRILQLFASRCAAVATSFWVNPRRSARTPTSTSPKTLA